MANTIKLKRGSGSDPSASDLVLGELAIRTDTGKIFLKKDNGNVAEVSGGGGVADGDKGDITVSNSGDTFTIDAGVIANGNIASNAAIAGSKINPSFTSNLSIENTAPEITFTDTTGSPDYKIRKQSGHFMIMETGQTNDSEWRFSIRNGGTVNIPGNLDVGAGLDVTGNITATGQLTLASGNNEQIHRFWTDTSDSDIDGLLSGSTFGTIQEGANHGHHVVALRENDTNDSFAIISGGGNYQTDDTYDKLVARFRANGNTVIGGDLELSGNIDLPDDAIIKLGDNDEFQIHHRGSDSVSLINEQGGGYLSLGSNGSKIEMYDIANARRMAVFNVDGACEFKHGATTRLATSSTGIDVTGNIDITDGTLIIDTNPESPNTSYGLQEAIRIDDGGQTGDRGLNIYEYRQGGARFFSLNFNLTSGSTGSAYTYTQGSWGGSTMLQFGNSGAFRFHVNSQVSGGSTDVITPTERFLIDTTGVTVTGNISVSGTVDGVDIAARNTLFGGLTSSSGVLINGVTATTQAQSDNSNKVSTTAYVRAAVANLVNSAPSTLDTLKELSDALGSDANFSTTVTNSIATKLPLAGGTLTGNLNLSSAYIDFSGSISTPSTAAAIYRPADNQLAFSTANVERVKIRNAGVDIKGDLTVEHSGHPTILLHDTSGDNQCRLQFQTDTYSWSAGLHGGEDRWKVSKSDTFGTNDYLEVDNGGSLHISNNIVVGGTVDGRDLSVDGSKLDGIEAGATADQTNSEIKTAYEANSNTNAFTDALLSKLNGIAASATNVTNNNQLTNGAGYITATLTNDQVQDIVGSMVTGNTESGITVTYQDSDGTLDFSIGTLGTSNIANNAIDFSKMQDIGAGRIIGNAGGSTGNPDHLTAAQVRTIINVEDGATADQSASEILTLLKTVDGSGSGLVAERVTVTDNSSDTSCFVLFTQGATGNQLPHSGSNLTFNASSGLLTATSFSGNGASLTNVNATTLDSIDSGSFLRSDQNDTMNGNYTITGSSDEKLVLNGGDPYIRFQENGANKAFVQWHSDGYLRLQNQEDASTLHIKDNFVFSPDNSSFYTIWHSGNDGSGSGLDADTVDNIQASSFARLDATSTFNCNGNAFHFDFDTAGRNSLVFLKNSSTKWQLVHTGSGDDLDWQKIGSGGSFKVEGNTVLTTASYDTHVCHLKTNVDAAIAQGSGNAFTVNFNLEESNDTSAFSHSSGVVTVLAAGWYRIYANMVYDNATASARNTMRAYVEKNGSEILSTRTYDYDRGASYGQFSNNKVETMLYLAANDTVSIGNYAFNEDGSVTIEAAECEFIVTSVSVATTTSNADTLDGEHGSYYRNASNINAGTLATARIPTLDQYIRSDANDTVTANLTFSSVTAPITTNSVKFVNSENDTNYYTDATGVLAFDENFYSDSQYGTEATAPAQTFTSNGGGLLVKNEDGWGALLSSQNIQYCEGNFANLKINNNQVFHAGNDGSGSGLDADTVDGLEASVLVKGNGTNNGVTEINVSDADFIVEDTTDGTTNFIWRDHSAGKLYLGTDNAVVHVRSHIGADVDSTHNIGSSATRFANIYGDQLYGAGSNITSLNASNLGSGTVAQARLSASTLLTLVKTVDGAGSGLDADTVDGLAATSFLRSNANNDSASGNYRTSGVYIEAGKGSGSVALTINDGYGNANIAFNHLAGIPDANGSANRIETSVDNGTGFFMFEIGNNVTAGSVVTLTSTLYFTTSAITFLGNTMWHAGNDGSGSGLDADTLDGAQGSSYLRTDATTTFNASGNDFNIDYDNSRTLVRIQRSGTEKIRLNASADTITVNLYNSAALRFGTGLIPSANNTYDLGSSSLRWNNLYVNDMHFSNEGKTNDVDGSWGDWTLQEGENDIFMINNRSGKKFKIAMIPV